MKKSKRTYLFAVTAFMSCAALSCIFTACAGGDQPPGMVSSQNGQAGIPTGDTAPSSSAYVESKARFLPDPVLRYDCGSDRFILLDDYLTPELTVPAGEYTDGASRPAIAELLGIKRYDRSLPACIVHDYMYREGLGSKKEADDLFAINLQRCRDQFSFPGLLIQPMVLAVRIGGRGSYSR